MSINYIKHQETLGTQRGIINECIDAVNQRDERPAVVVGSVEVMVDMIATGEHPIGELFSVTSDESVHRYEGDGRVTLINEPPSKPYGYIRVVSVATSNISLVSYPNGVSLSKSKQCLE